MNKVSYCCDECGIPFGEPISWAFCFSREVLSSGIEIAKTERRIVSPCCKSDFESFREGSGE
jgi:hypothetical protein